MAKVLTIQEANRLARGRAKVTVDPEDGRLWQVERPGSVEAHEPMTREAWRAFLDTGEAAPTPTSGRHEMVAYSGEGKKVLADVVRDNLSPQAVAAVVRCILTGKRARADVDREVLWLTNLLVSDVLGGPEALDRLVTEAGM